MLKHTQFLCCVVLCVLASGCSGFTIKKGYEIQSTNGLKLEWSTNPSYFNNVHRYSILSVPNNTVPDNIKFHMYSDALVFGSFAPFPLFPIIPVLLDSVNFLVELKVNNTAVRSPSPDRLGEGYKFALISSKLTTDTEEIKSVCRKKDTYRMRPKYDKNNKHVLDKEGKVIMHKAYRNQSIVCVYSSKPDTADLEITLQYKPTKQNFTFHAVLNREWWVRYFPISTLTN